MKSYCSSSTAAGWTSCAIGAMSLLGKLPDRNTMRQTTRVWPTAEPIERLLGWLVSRQIPVLCDEEYSDRVETGTNVRTDDKKAQASIQAEDHPVMAPSSTSPDECGIEPSEDELQFAGFAGRCNKAADTCYAFWAGGSLKVRSSFIHQQRGFLTSLRCSIAYT